MQISDDQEALVRTILGRVLGAAGQAVWVVGSRARGQARGASDLDLLIDCQQGLPLQLQAALTDAFEESDLPFHVDLVDGATLDPAARARMMAGAVRLI